jgi:hypothetical protein
MKFVPTAFTLTFFDATVRAAQRHIMFAAARITLYATRPGWGFSPVALVWTTRRQHRLQRVHHRQAVLLVRELHVLRRLFEDVLAAVPGGADEHRVVAAELLHGGVHHLLDGAGHALVVGALLLETGDHDHLVGAQVRELLLQALLHVRDDQAVAEARELLGEVGPDVQLRIGHDGHPLARGRVGPQLLRIRRLGLRPRRSGCDHPGRPCGSRHQQIPAIHARALVVRVRTHGCLLFLDGS